MRTRFPFLAITATLVTLSRPAAAAPPREWGDRPQWGDRGNGTYLNPVLPSDYSDLDCIRVGSDYYAISSTFQFSPGMVILHSRDLVNGTILGHVVSDVSNISPEMNWGRMNHYGTGIWAGSIRYAKGRFWIFFGTPDEGYFMTSAPPRRRTVDAHASGAQKQRLGRLLPVLRRRRPGISHRHQLRGRLQDLPMETHAG